MNISISELKRRMNSEKINLIDIRNNNKYDQGTISYAINIDATDLLYNYYKYLDKDKVYYIFCDNGSKSFKISNILNSIGYKVYNVDGGYNKYIVEK